MTDHKIYRYDSILGSEYYMALPGGEVLRWDGQECRWESRGYGSSLRADSELAIPPGAIPLADDVLPEDVQKQYAIDL
ncbi:MAG: hypothetical protein O7J95_20595 [Planctomycetota bacterium]|nr:hypothetical protein [Planctomycetota bacterium]